MNTLITFQACIKQIKGKQVKILRGAAAVTLYINGAGILLLGIELSSTLHGGSIFFSYSKV